MTQPDIPIDVLSFGVGVQSSTLALMASTGEIKPKLKCGIFADTQQEPESVYHWLSYLCGVEVKIKPDPLTGGLKPYVDSGVYVSGVLTFPVHIVTAGDIGADALRVRVRRDGKGSWVPSGVPHYSINADGSLGHGPRQCTHDFKLIPIEREQRRIIGSAPMRTWKRMHGVALREISRHAKEMTTWKRTKKAGGDIGPAPLRPELAWAECQSDPLLVAWIGISTDEASRMKPSRVPWVLHRWPHIERGINRDGCIEWLQHRGLVAPRSACRFCPYHDDDEWIRLRDLEPQDFDAAVKFDYAYRAAKVKTVLRKGFKPFLHPDRVPLDQVKFVKSHGKQLTMFNNECQGMCGV